MSWDSKKQFLTRCPKPRENNKKKIKNGTDFLPTTTYLQVVVIYVAKHTAKRQK